MKSRQELVRWLSDRHTQVARIVDMALVYAESNDMSFGDALDKVLLPHEVDAGLAVLAHELHSTYRQQTRLILDAIA